MRVVVTAICTGGATKLGVYELDVPVREHLPVPAGHYGEPIPVYQSTPDFMKLLRKLTLRCTQTECLADNGAVHAVIEVGAIITATYTTEPEHYEHLLGHITELSDFMETIQDINPEESEPVAPARSAAA